MIRGRAIRNERGNSQHPKRSTYTKNRWERLSLRYIRRLRTRNGWLAISRVSNVRIQACAGLVRARYLLGLPAPPRVAIPLAAPRNVRYRSVDIDSARGDNDRSVPFRIPAPLSGNCGPGASRQDGYYLLPSRCSCTPKTYGTFESIRRVYTH